MRRLNKRTKALAAALGGALSVGAGALWLIAPGRVKKEQRALLRGRYFAHRGLYDRALGLPENSLGAFRRAAEHGYGAELDVRMTRDGVLVVSHDANLRRMTGADCIVEEQDYEALASLRLDGTDEGVPLFADALDALYAAGVPVIVEIKPTSRARRGAVCSAVLSELDRRDGAYCVESFDPFIVRWFRRNAPDVLRGQLTAQRREFDLPAWQTFLLSHGMYNCLGRPQFIAHRVGRKTLGVRLAECLGAMRVCWTASDYGQERKNDAIIFEHFLPPVRFHD